MPNRLIRLICEHPTPSGQDGEQVVFDVEPGNLIKAIARLKLLGWKEITVMEPSLKSISTND